MNHLMLLPSPREIYKLALSLLSSAVNQSNHRKASIDHLAACHFDVDPETGFFPRHPLARLPEPFALWEDALAEAGENLSLGNDDSEEGMDKRPRGEIWRANIRSWPVLSIEYLNCDQRLLQRAHMVTAWLVNFYVHSMPPATDQVLVPQSLAVPLVNISRLLGIAPVLTFADTVLWNWELINPSRPVSVDNIQHLFTFSGTEDERNFYVASARAELRGVEFLRIIGDYRSLPNVTELTSISKISRDLNRLTGVIEDIREIIQSVRPTCDPHVFYWSVRPWFEGSGDGKGPSGPKWIYEGVPESDSLDLSGPSAGQSSVMHALDIFLDVDHKLRTRRYPAPNDGNKRAEHGFMERMRRYMPGRHRDYLNDIAASNRPIRDLASKTPALREPFDSAVMALKKLRDSHLRIACLYIVTMARSTPLGRVGCPVLATLERLERAGAAGKGLARGTGGNEVSVLLKAGRDATSRTVLKDNKT